jgi:aminoglycoside/choline kinase family phosphotransferase
LQYKGHLKVLGIFKRLAARDNKKNYLVHIPRVIRMLKKNLNNKEFRPISKILIPLLNHD